MKSVDRQTEVVGVAGPRIDGPLKVTGEAAYTADHLPLQITYAVPVSATIGKGRVVKLDLERARRMKGVLRIYAHGNLPMYRHGVDEKMVAHTDEQRPPFEDEIIRYYGQYVAVVVAETFEVAQSAANAIAVEYAAETPDLTHPLKAQDLQKTESERGKVDPALASAAVSLDETYITPVEVHNPIEMHASVAEWNGDKLNLFEATQAIMNHRAVIAGQLGVPRENVRVISRFLGSGFGGKLWPWPHSVLTAAIAREIGRPVKLVVTRPQMFTNVGHRPRTEQRVRLGATRDGKLTALAHDYVSEGAMLDSFKENCGEATPYLYSTPHLRVTSAIARRNVASPTSMRGPGAVPGLFALESAMDEMAHKAGLDPLAFRLINEPKLDESTGQKFSSRHLRECLEFGAKRFGWDKRQNKIGSMREGNEILGWGLAACSWGAKRLACKAVVEFSRDGTVRVSAATQDIGTGTYTVLSRILEREFGVGPEKIRVTLGDSELTPGPLSGGSMATASVIPAVVNACAAAAKQLLKVASTSPKSPFSGAKPEELKFGRGRVIGGGGKQVEFGELLRLANVAALAGEGSSEPVSVSADGPWSLHSYGAHFVEVGWRPEIARLRVRRVVTVIDGGHIVNLLPARNQVEGAIVMGVGMALFEEAIYDPRTAKPLNGNLADYVVATHADCPAMDVTFLDHPDQALNPYGARGIGEIGLAGVAPALASAVYHATGKRVRELPITIEKLI